MMFDLSTWSLQAPAFLWGLAVIPLLILARERSVAGHPPGRSFGALIGRCLAIALLCTAAARPVEDVERPDRSLVLAVDASGSIGAERRAAARRWMSDLAEDAGDVPVRVVLGTDPPRVVDLDAAREALGDTTSRGTDLRNLLELGLAALPPARHQEVVLLSDGVATRGRLEEAVRVASARDLAVHAIGLGPSELQARVVDVQPEQDRLLGQEVEIRVDVATNAPLEASVVVASASGEVAREAVSLPVGTTRVALTWTPPSAGMHGLTASLEGNEGDARPEDDALDALVRVRPRPAALVVGDPGEAAALRSAVSGFRPALRIDEARDLPAPPYGEHRLIVLLDPDLPAGGGGGAPASAPGLGTVDACWSRAAKGA